MEQGYSLSNLFKNTTKGQKIGVGLFLLIAVVLLIVLMTLLSDSFLSDNEEVEQTEEPTEEVVEEQYVNSQGYTVTKKTTIYPDGEESVEETKMDEYGNVTTVDPDLITTYFPYQVIREHSDWGPTLRYYLSINYDDNVINALIEFCDVDEDKTLVQQYLDSIPLDLSAYTVNYEIFSEDAICDK